MPNPVLAVGNTRGGHHRALSSSHRHFKASKGPGFGKMTHPRDQVGTHALCQALAGGPSVALVEARAVLDRAADTTDVDWHAETVVTIAIV